MFILFLRRRETEHERGRVRERGRHRIWTGSRLWAISTEPDAGLKLTDHEIMTWAKVGRLIDWATKAPLNLVIFYHSPSHTHLNHALWHKYQLKKKCEVESNLSCLYCKFPLSLHLWELSDWSLCYCFNKCLNNSLTDLCIPKKASLLPVESTVLSHSLRNTFIHFICLIWYPEYIHFLLGV